jgi:hypothetical protein
LYVHGGETQVFHLQDSSLSGRIPVSGIGGTREAIAKLRLIILSLGGSLGGLALALVSLILAEIPV